MVLSTDTTVAAVYRFEIVATPLTNAADVTLDYSSEFCSLLQDFPILTTLVEVVVPWQLMVPSKARVNILLFVCYLLFR